jgi:hypothetical protein
LGIAADADFALLHRVLHAPADRLPSLVAAEQSPSLKKLASLLATKLSKGRTAEQQKP